jgi:Domain of unknown function (DUF4340)
MSTELAERRKGRALQLVLLAAGLAATTFVTLAIDARSSRPDTAAGPVVAGLSERISGAQRIIVTSADATYRIEKTSRGWAMRDRGDYPVLAGRLAQLTEGLEGLQLIRRMTSDAAKHERLGVGDPREGGRGVLVQIEDGRGAFLVNLILGVETDGLYVRRPDQDQTWAARGELPPLRDIASWLDLQPVEIAPEAIARVEITPSVGPPYTLARAADDEFEIVSPAVQVLAASSVTATGERIAGLSPIDVQPAPAIQGAARARVRVITVDGIAIEGELIDSDGKTWLKLVARTENPERQAAALAINDRAAGWAYALSPLDASVLVPPLSQFLPGAGETP